jgi:hypothetical protein
VPAERDRKSAVLRQNQRKIVGERIGIEIQPDVKTTTPNQAVPSISGAKPTILAPTTRLEEEGTQRGRGGEGAGGRGRQPLYVLVDAERRRSVKRDEIG